MNTSDKKAVFFDIDGTLVDDYNQVPESAAKAITRLRQNGHLAIINTGRTFVSVGEHIRSVGFDGYICACGSRVYYNGEEIFTQTIPTKCYPDIIRILRKTKAPVFFEGPEAVYFDPHNEGQTEHLKHVKAYFTDITGGRVYDLPKDPEESRSLLFDKFFCLFTPDEDISELEEYVKDDFLSIRHRDGHFEVTAKGCSKAQGIQAIIDSLGISRDNCYALGDSANDLEMLKAVPHSIGMGNSAEVILPYCEYITKGVTEDGILHALEHYELI